MGDVQDPENAKHQGKAHGHQEEEAAVDQAVQKASARRLLIGDREPGGGAQAARSSPSPGI